MPRPAEEETRKVGLTIPVSDFARLEWAARRMGLPHSTYARLLVMEGVVRAEAGLVPLPAVTEATER